LHIALKVLPISLLITFNEKFLTTSVIRCSSR